MTGSEYLVEFLLKKNTKRIFGYPGNAVLNLFNDLQKSALDKIIVKHEQGAIHAAEGFAKVTGEVGVCIVTSGPGATNLVTGLCDAMLDSVPIIAITGQVDNSAIGHDAFQEADMMGITIPITKHNYLVKNVENLPTVLEEAWRISTSGRKGPVLIDITRDVFTADLPNNFSLNCRLPRKRESEITLDKTKNRVIRAINSSYRPIFLVGGGMNKSACKKAVEFCEKNSIPIVYTLMGKNHVNHLSKNVLGMVGVHGMPGANSAFSRSDLVIAVGTRFSDRTLPNPEEFGDTKVIIHVDIDEAELSKNVYVKIPVVSEAENFSVVLAEIEISDKKHGEWSDWFAKDYMKKSLIPLENIFDERFIIRTISENITSPTVYVTDVGVHQIIAAQECIICENDNFVTSGGLGTMGFGLPAAIGSSFAKSDSNIILFSGDGSFQMTFQELATLRYLKNPIKIFVFDNASLELVRDLQKSLDPENDGYCLIKNPDFAMIAAAYGIKSIVIENKRQFLESISEIINSNENILVHLKLNPGGELR